MSARLNTFGPVSQIGTVLQEYLDVTDRLLKTTKTTRHSVCRVFLVTSVLFLIGIGLVLSIPPARVPLFVINAVLILPVIALGSRWQRLFGCGFLVLVLFLADQEYSAGKSTHTRAKPPRSSRIQE